LPRRAEDRPGLVVLTIELEGALLATQGPLTPAKLTSPYRAPLTKFLNKYAGDSIAYFLDPTRMLVRQLPESPAICLPLYLT
jgi:transformation/transcription domain-associated protein